MIQRFHGLDVHRSFTTVSVLNNGGEENNFIPHNTDLLGYVSKLGSEDAAVLEASTGAFYMGRHNQISRREMLCY